MDDVLRRWCCSPDSAHRSVRLQHPRARDRSSRSFPLVRACAPACREPTKRAGHPLFPALTTEPLDEARIRRLLGSMTGDHTDIAVLLERIRAASDDFSLPHWACTSYRTLFSELWELEADIFIHVHLENHVLKPRFVRSPA